MKNVFITGGARGIGRALAICFAQREYRVGISYCSSYESAKELSDIYGIYTFQADLSISNGVEQLSESVLNNFGAVDVLINNAGISSYGLFQDISSEEFDKLFQVNFKSAYFLTKALIGDMLRKKSGSIINISSVWGQTGASCEVLYSSAKAAMIGFTKALAKELAPSGITVNCIAPGVVDTDMMNRFTAEEKRQILEEIPICRFTEPNEIAELAFMLCSEKCKSITGQVIGINGGMYC